MQDFVQSFARGIAVLCSFSAEAPRQSVADAARATGLPRATVRRLLLTLEALGYVRAHDGRFEPTARVLDIGYAYLSALGVNTVARPILENLSAELHESCSAAVLDDTDMVYVVRVPTQRIMTVSIGLGSRFPAFQTSMGRVLLAELSDAEIIDRYERSDRSRVTPYTPSSATAVLDRIEEVRGNGWAVNDQELELGLRSIAAPVRGTDGLVAAINVATHVGRTDLAELHQRFLPALLASAAAVGDGLSSS